MNKVQQLLIDLVNIAVFDKNIIVDNKSEDLWTQLFKELTVHNLECIVFDEAYKILKNEQFESKLINDWKIRSMTRVLSFKRRCRVLPDIMREFIKNGIDILMIKGFTFKNLYPHPDTRLMSDLDLLVNENDLDKSVKIFEQFGYKKADNIEQECNLVLVKKDSVMIELHFKLFPSVMFNNNKTLIDLMWEETEVEYIESVPVQVPSYTNSYVYFILHMAKHFALTGFGIRQLIDFSLYMQKNNKKINYDRANVLLKAYSADIIAVYISELCNVLFDMTISVEKKLVRPDIFDFTLQQIFQSGIFGHRNKETTLESIFIQNIQNPKGELRSKFNTRLHILFPKSNYMGYRYKYAKKHTLFLPIAWIHRGIHQIISPNKEANFLLKDQPDMDHVKKRVEVLKYFNLGIK